MIRRLMCLLSILALCCVFTACKDKCEDDGANANGGNGGTETPDDGDGSPELQGTNEMPID